MVTWFEKIVFYTLDMWSSLCTHFKRMHANALSLAATVKSFTLKGCKWHIFKISSGSQGFWIMAHKLHGAILFYFNFFFFFFHVLKEVSSALSCLNFLSVGQLFL